MFTKLKTLFQKITPKSQDQSVGLLILFAFCFFSYSLGLYSGEESYTNKNPEQAALADQHITKLLESIQCQKH